eukprot:TRINITY_DN6718_c0_g1_i1.p1 TRINITY_DN6718_c0_g1~~TRINITY_DN6718_c0_g1_i1.p1  ORF type:complete len:1218 (-),score=373.90 TRINITY_DN6718_c0_g1_i1:17-3670(-)
MRRNQTNIIEEGEKEISKSSDNSMVSEDNFKGDAINFLFGLFNYDNLSTNLVALKNIKIAAVGREHVLLLSEGLVYSWGNGSKGQLGHNDKTSINQPKIIDSISKHIIVSISAGADKSTFLNTKGEAYICGDVYPDFDEPIVSPQIVCKTHVIKEILCGEKHSIFVTNKGKAYTFGVNERSALGNPSIPPKSMRSSASPNELNVRDVVSIATFEYSSALVTQKGEVYYWGKTWDSMSEISKPIKLVGPDVKMVKVQLGYNFLIALSDNGDFYSIGYGAHGQTGTVATNSSGVAVKQSFEKINFGTKTVPEKKESRFNFLKKKKSNDTKTKTDPIFSCGPYYCVCVHDGNVYIWGSQKDTVSNQFSLISPVPIQIPDMSMMQVKQFWAHPKHLFAVVGMHNLPNIRFSSFDPPVVESGTLEGIIDFLLQDFSEDFSDTFFLTYTFFISGKDLLDFLEKRWNEYSNSEDSVALKTRIILFMEKWTKSKQNLDIFELENIFERVHKFIEMITQNNPTFQSKILKLLAKENSFYKPPPSIDKDLTNLFFEMNPKEVAEQICLVEQHIFSAITGSEFLKTKWQKSKENAQNIIRGIDCFNNFSNWCSSTILQTPNEKIRSERANKWLLIAEECFKLNNFSAYTWICCVYSSSTIFNLSSKGIIKLKPRSQEILSNYIDFFDIRTKEYKAKINELSNKQVPGVYCLGNHLTEFTYLEEMRLYNENMINWKKCIQVGTLIKTLNSLIITKYPFEKKELFNFLFYVRGLERENLDILSKQLKEGVTEIDPKMRSSMVVTNESLIKTSVQNLESLRRRIEVQTSNSKGQSMENLVIGFISAMSDKENMVDAGGYFITYRDAFNKTKGFENIFKYYLINKYEEYFVDQSPTIEMKKNSSSEVIDVLNNIAFNSKSGIHAFANEYFTKSYRVKKGNLWKFLTLVVGSNMTDEEIINTVAFIEEFNNCKLNEEQINQLINNLAQYKFFDSFSKVSSSPFLLESFSPEPSQTSQFICDFYELFSYFSQQEIKSSNVDFLSSVQSQFDIELSNKKLKLEDTKNKKENYLSSNLGGEFKNKMNNLEDEIYSLEKEEKELILKLEKLRSRKFELKRELESHNNKAQELMKDNHTILIDFNKQIQDSQDEIKAWESFSNVFQTFNSTLNSKQPITDIPSLIKEKSLGEVLKENLQKFLNFLQIQKDDESFSNLNLKSKLENIALVIELLLHQLK